MPVFAEKSLSYPPTSSACLKRSNPAVTIPAAARLAPDRWILVTYDEVLADPNATAARLCKFAGMRWTEHVASQRSRG